VRRSMRWAGFPAQRAASTPCRGPSDRYGFPRGVIMVESGDLATWVGALATAVAGGFAGWQLLLLRRQQAAAAWAELNGVAVTWVQKVKPNSPDPDGSALWVFEITVHNPGRLPIRNVQVEMTFPVEVCRTHFDGTVDEPVRVVDVGLPVLAGASHHTWERKLRMEFNEAHSLRTISAHVTFLDLVGRTHSNVWGAADDGR